MCFSLEIAASGRRLSAISRSTEQRHFSFFLLFFFVFSSSFHSILAKRSRKVERQFERRRELCSAPDPPFRGTPNQPTRFRRLHHVALVLPESRQSSRLSRSFFLLRFPHQPLRVFPLLFPCSRVEADGGYFDSALRDLFERHSSNL